MVYDDGTFVEKCRLMSLFLAKSCRWLNLFAYFWVFIVDASKITKQEDEETQ